MLFIWGKSQVWRLTSFPEDPLHSLLCSYCYIKSVDVFLLVQVLIVFYLLNHVYTICFQHKLSSWECLFSPERKTFSFEITHAPLLLESLSGIRLRHFVGSTCVWPFLWVWVHHLKHSYDWTTGIILVWAAKIKKSTTRCALVCTCPLPP